MTQEEIITDIVTKADLVVSEKLRPARKLVDEVKHLMQHGTDSISTVQIQDWAIVIPIMCEELTPYQEAYSLTKALWDIDIKQQAAKNLLDYTKKRTEIENLNRIAGTEGEQKKAIASYMHDMLQSTREALWMLGNTLRKILDARIANGEAK